MRLSFRTSPVRPAAAVLALGATALACALIAPVLATPQPGPLLVTVSTSPNPYAIEGMTSVANSKGILGYATGPTAVGLQGYVTQPGSTGIAGSAQATSGATSNGVFGISANGTGVFGITTSASFSGIYGANKTAGGVGVYGNAAGLGVEGISSATNGIEGITQTSSGDEFNVHYAGVLGVDKSKSGHHYGVAGETANYSGVGVFGVNSSNGGGYGGLFEGAATAVDAFSTATNGGAAQLGLPTGEGAIVQGSSGMAGHPVLSIVSLATDTPLIEADSLYEDYIITPSFMVQGTSANRSGTAKINGGTDVQVSGDLYVTGGIYENCAAFPATATTQCGDVTPAAAANAVQKATLEDEGEGQIVAGTGYVALDQNYARTVRFDRPYLVYLTPQGDTKGLYVASKTPRGFTVRETQGGRGTIAFDYRIQGVPLRQPFVLRGSVRGELLTAALRNRRRALSVNLGAQPQAPAIPAFARVGERPRR